MKSWRALERCGRLGARGRGLAHALQHMLFSVTALAGSIHGSSLVPRECFFPRTRRAPPGVCVVSIQIFVHPLDAIWLPLFIARTVLLTLWARSHCGSSPVAFLSFARPPTVLYICICGCGERCSTLSVGWQVIS